MQLKKKKKRLKQSCFSTFSEVKSNSFQKEEKKTSSWNLSYKNLLQVPKGKER